ncbi:MAG: diaminopropionate ammonia-lyase [Eubacteriaceae bacterium]|nr:diaminopropionate ammonia-lyase [Eubacteriaceae bacterium]
MKTNHTPEEIEILINPNKEPLVLPERFNKENYSQIRSFHQSLPAYRPTPLISLKALAETLGVKAIYIKDESHRFGLNAFKALGASWAMEKLIKEENAKAEENSPTKLKTETVNQNGKATSEKASALNDIKDNLGEKLAAQANVIDKVNQDSKITKAEAKAYTEICSKNCADAKSSTVASVKASADNENCEKDFAEAKTMEVTNAKAKAYNQICEKDFAEAKSLAVTKVKAKAFTFVTATDGNHGKAVAWAAANAGARAFVFMPKGSAESRVEAIRALGACVEVTDFNYDATVAHAAEFAKKNGYFLMQDTGFEGYTATPWNITMGYTTMASEAIEQMEGLLPTHVFLQAGVGSMAGGVMGYLLDSLRNNPPFVSIVEAAGADCIYQSALNGKITRVEGECDTIMAGLNCGSVSLCVYELLMQGAKAFIKCSDSISEEGMRRLARPQAGDKPIVSGESGAVTAGLVCRLCEDEAYSEGRELLGLNKDSVILLFSTEGATDPVNYEKVLNFASDK